MTAHRPAIRPMPTLLALLAAIVLLTACGNDGGSSTPTPGNTRSAPVEQILADNKVTYDLRRALTRDEVGLTPGQAQLAIDHPGGEPLIEVTLILPGDVRVEIPSAVINIAAIGVDDPDPTTLELVRSYPSVEDAAAELASRAEILALDPGSIDRWADWASTFMAEGGTASGATFASRAFPNTTFGHVTLSASTGTFADTGQVRVHYHLTWSAEG